MTEYAEYVAELNATKSANEVRHLLCCIAADLSAGRVSRSTMLGSARARALNYFRQYVALLHESYLPEDIVRSAENTTALLAASRILSGMLAGATPLANDFEADVAALRSVYEELKAVIREPLGRGFPGG